MGEAGSLVSRTFLKAPVSPLLLSALHRLHGRPAFINVPLRIHVPRAFPGGSVVKNPPANAEDTGSNPGPGRYHMPQNN